MVAYQNFQDRTTDFAPPISLPTRSTPSEGKSLDDKRESEKTHPRIIMSISIKMPTEKSFVITQNIVTRSPHRIWYT